MFLQPKEVNKHQGDNDVNTDVTPFLNSDQAAVLLGLSYSKLNRYNRKTMDRSSTLSRTVSCITGSIWRLGQRSGGLHRLPTMAATGTTAQTREEEEPVLLWIPHLKR